MIADIKVHDIRVILTDEEIARLERNTLKGTSKATDYYGLSPVEVSFSLELKESIDHRHVNIDMTNQNKETIKCHLQIDPRALEELKSKKIITEHWAGDFYSIGIYHSDFLKRIP